jgi:hypothetical protein
MIRIKENYIWHKRRKLPPLWGGSSSLGLPWKDKEQKRRQARGNAVCRPPSDDGRTDQEATAFPRRAIDRGSAAVGLRDDYRRPTPLESAVTQSRAQTPVDWAAVAAAALAAAAATNGSCGLCLSRATIEATPDPKPVNSLDQCCSPVCGSRQ